MPLARLDGLVAAGGQRGVGYALAKPHAVLLGQHLRAVAAFTGFGNAQLHR
jgi:hypothetical protein